MSLNPRKTAADIIYNVLKKCNTLSHELNGLRNKSEFCDLDIRFISELTNGVLRKLEYIDYIISLSSDIKIKKISPYVLAVLRCGVYQLVFMDKVPASAAVNESVKVVKKSSNHRLAGFVNAVLRKADLVKNTFDLPSDVDVALSVKYSCPLWLINKLSQNCSDVKKLLEAMNNKSATILRVNKTLTSADHLLELLSASGWECDRFQSDIFPDIDFLLIADKIDNLENSMEFKKGLFYIQDAAAAYVGYVLNPTPHSTVLDMCSSPGGKATHLAEIMNNTGKVWAFDISQKKIDRINENAKRLGLCNINAVVADSSQYNEEFFEVADYVLVDSPCSGIGIIRKKPDIKYLRKETDIAELKRISLDILNNAVRYLKPGGTMAFSTCTILKDENEDVLFEFLKMNPNLKLKKINCQKDNDGYMTLYPHTDGCDGFFISLIEKEK